jgi:hypothetical protein
MPEPQCNRGYTALKSAILANEPPQAAPGVFTENALLNGAIAVYRNNVRAAYYRVLRDAFPVVHKLVGDSYFRRLAHDYFLAHPPASRLVARYGDNLPAFIAAYPSCASFPYLSDVARFEILWLQAYHAQECAPLPVDAITRRLAVDPDLAMIRLHPSARIFASRFPISEIWRNNRKDDPAPMSIRPTQEYILLVRPEQDVRVQEISRGAYLTLRSLEETARLGEAFGKEFDAGEDLASVFQQIFAASVIADISHV